MRKVLLIVMGIMIAVCISCGKSKKENKPVDVKNSKEESVEQRILENDYRIDVTWENLEETILKIRYFLYDADLQIKFEKDNTLYSKGQFDKKFKNKGFWGLDSAKKSIMLDIKDIGNKSEPFLSGNFKSFCVMNSKIGKFHSIIFHNNETFPKRNDFNDYLNSSDYLILFTDQDFEE
ncbi:MAG TPA: hypothetical protein PLH15_09045 [Spirochaetota bacterium]|jgi:hypothetical protein|nr:hypothetical protein [Spirochaetota bacterium]HQO22703.1 hypothetical protein [Spirochaetota bacterium]HQQ23971.1 hypothetical protein [Spirochaetota bacterium]